MTIAIFRYSRKMTWQDTTTWLRIKNFDYSFNYTLIVVVVVTLTRRYLVNAVRGHKTGSNALEWKITSEGKKQHKIHTRIYGFSCLLASPLFSLPPSRNSDPGSHNRLPPPCDRYGLCVTF